MLEPTQENLALVKPAAAGSVPFSQWLRKHLGYLFLGEPDDLGSPPVAFTNFFSQTLLMTYGIDGYDILTHHITTAYREGEAHPQQTFEYLGEPLPASLLWLAFLGLPSRPDSVDAPEHNHTLKSPRLTAWGFAKLLIGGWDSLPDEPRFQGKNTWQRRALPIKIGVILPLKFAALFLNLAINVVKLFSELLPALASYGCYRAIKTLRNLTKRHPHDALAGVAEQQPDSTTDTAGEDESPVTEAIPLIGLSAKSSMLASLKRTIASIKIRTLLINFLALPTLAILHGTFKLLTLIGRAITSPEKSSKLAYAYGAELQGPSFGLNFARLGINETLYLMGILSLYLNKTITAVVWAIALAFALSAVAFYFPALFPAITWVVQLPLVTALLNSLNGLLVSIATTFASDFGPVVGALSSWVGLPVPLLALAIGTTVGFMAVPVTIVLSKLAHEFSNRWASWHEGGFIDGFWRSKVIEPSDHQNSASKPSSLSTDTLADETKQGTSTDSRDRSLPVSEKSKGTGKALSDSYATANQSAQSLEQSGQRLETNQTNSASQLNQPLNLAEPETQPAKNLEVK